MSRPRSRSPHYRGLPLEDSGFDCYMREDMYPEDERRSSPHSDDRHFGRQHHSDQEEFYRRRPSPHHDMTGYDKRRFSPQRGRGRGEARRRGGGFRGRFHNFENRGRSLDSPLRSMREREPGMGWGREEPDRGRFRDQSPSQRSEDHRGGGEGGGGGGGWDRGRRNPHHGPNRDRRRDEPYHERNPPFKKPRRETDDVGRPGFRDEEDFEEQRYSLDSPGAGLGGGGRQGSLPRGDSRHSGPIVVEHDHGREPSRWDHYDGRRDPGFERQRSPRPSGSSQERFRSDNRENDRPGPFRDNWRDSGFHSPRRSPVRYDNRSGPGTYRGRGGPRPGRGRFTHNHGGRTGPLRNPPRPQHPSQGYQDPPSEDPRPGYSPHVEEPYESPIQEDPDWENEPRVHQWKQDRPRSLDQRPPGVDLDPKMPRQRMQGWKETRNSDVNVVTEETLTIKVDMSRPVTQNSSLCYSSDRQLSLDLVNVGRQRLDFLPMLEHSGTYRETATHTGTFAQEIITLVHHVKEQYFRDDGVTLNQRFSAPQKEQAEMEELTLDQRFSSNRGFSLNMQSLLDDDDDDVEDDEPLFSQVGPLQPVRGPGDLRHDLERRRQERLEGVKVTISGNTMSQRLQGPDSDDMAPMDDAEFSEWPEEQTRRREGDMGPRRGGGGGPFRPHTGFQRRNNRFGPRVGPMRRQNSRYPSAGPNW